MFESGFPAGIWESVRRVEERISRETYRQVRVGVSEERCRWDLESGTVIEFPYRIWFCDDLAAGTGFSEVERMVYDCIFSRSCDGFVRERHIREILKGEFPEWAFPYVVKVCDEYVMEILESVYEGLRDRDNTEIQRFCSHNLKQFLYGYDRMISYWNEFYRDRCKNYRDYIGRKLYMECLGYSRSMERMRYNR